MPLLLLPTPYLRFQNAASEEPKSYSGFQTTVDDRRRPITRLEYPTLSAIPIFLFFTSILTLCRPRQNSIRRRSALGSGSSSGQRLTPPSRTLNRDPRSRIAFPPQTGGLLGSELLGDPRTGGVLSYIE